MKPVPGWVVLVLLFLLFAEQDKETMIVTMSWEKTIVLVAVALYLILAKRYSKKGKTLPEPEEIAEKPTEEGNKISRHIPVASKRLAWGRFLLEYYSNPANVGKPLRAQDYEYDHIIALAQGGTHDPENIRVIPKKENRAKGAKTLEEFETSGKNP